MLALAGRVPVKVITSKPIVRGDMITTSGVGGYGTKAVKAGMTVGSAMQSSEEWDESRCSLVDSMEEIKWPKGDGANLDKPCFRVPTASLGDNAPDGAGKYAYVGKLMALGNLSYYNPPARSDIAAMAGKAFPYGILILSAGCVLIIRRRGRGSADTGRPAAGEAGRGFDVAVAKGDCSRTIRFRESRADKDYGVQVVPGWDTNTWVSEKTAEGFRVNFKSAPAGATFDWILLR